MNYKHRLLIVDGNPYVAGILVQTLKTDFDVIVASTGQEAVQLLTQGKRFDCILTELNLPNFSGLELTRFVRTNKLIRHTPIIVLSNASDSDTRINCLEQGADSYMAKPFNPLEVKARFHALLRRAIAPVDYVQERSLPVRLQPKSRPLEQLKFRILSMVLRDYPVSQSA